MIGFLLHAMVLADAEDRYRGMHEYMSEPRTPWWSLLFWARGEAGFGPRRRLGPWRLFFRLIWRAPLSWRQRWTLWSLARHASRDCPAAILLTPSALVQAAGRWTGDGCESAGARTARVALAGEVLFGHPIEMNQPPE